MRDEAAPGPSCGAFFDIGSLMTIILGARVPGWTIHPSCTTATVFSGGRLWQPYFTALGSIALL